MGKGTGPYSDSLNESLMETLEQDTVKGIRDRYGSTKVQSGKNKPRRHRRQHSVIPDDAGDGIFGKGHPPAKGKIRRIFTGITTVLTTGLTAFTGYLVYWHRKNAEVALIAQERDDHPEIESTATTHNCSGQAALMYYPCSTSPLLKDLCGDPTKHIDFSQGNCSVTLAACDHNHPLWGGYAPTLFVAGALGLFSVGYLSKVPAGESACASAMLSFIFFMMSGCFFYGALEGVLPDTRDALWYLCDAVCSTVRQNNVTVHGGDWVPEASRGIDFNFKALVALVAVTGVLALVSGRECKRVREERRNATLMGGKDYQTFRNALFETDEDHQNTEVHSIGSGLN